VASTVISKDEFGNSKGFGFVCFTNPINAEIAIKNIKTNGVAFPGLPPLYVSLAMKKDERGNFQKRPNVQENYYFLSRLIQSEEEIVIINKLDK
jgi:polyadenylate-binding protein